ncbi:MAG: hypothetical protein [Wendovervirus sonii]|uniref:Peptidase M48 domain-containing protein n=1 Tax=phage Lak_Megaphage_Sonny TaxID=3109229 RepID=A0ABZ0Z3C2_9CAUD|nr:MAG: hypothetical protein [phage Lak_Megaphage_Sonny]
MIGGLFYKYKNTYFKMRNSRKYCYDRDAVTYESALYSLITHDMIQESYHVVNTFVDCALDIVRMLDESDILGEIYSGWSFDIANKQCIKAAENEGETFKPVYLNIINDDSYICSMSTTDRSNSSDKIIITINYAKLINNTYDEVIAILSHEFRHVLEMYIDEKKSHINDTINEMIDDPIKKHTNKIIFNDAVNIVNLFAESEERSRIDGTIHYLKNINTNTENTNENYKKIAYLIKISNNMHKMYDMQISLADLDILMQTQNFQKILLVGYLYNKYCLKLDIEITEEMIHNWLKYKNDATEILKFLNNNFERFYKKLIDCIVTHLII